MSNSKRFHLLEPENRKLRLLSAVEFASMHPRGPLNAKGLLFAIGFIHVCSIFAFAGCATEQLALTKALPVEQGRAVVKVAERQSENEPDFKREEESYVTTVSYQEPVGHEAAQQSSAQQYAGQQPEIQQYPQPQHWEQQQSTQPGTAKGASYPASRSNDATQNQPPRSYQQSPQLALQGPAPTGPAPTGRVLDRRHYGNVGGTISHATEARNAPIVHSFGDGPINRSVGQRVPMHHAAWQRPPTQSHPAQTTSETAPSPADAEPMYSSVSPQGQSSVNLVGSEFRNPDKTATEIMLELKDENLALKDKVRALEAEIESFKDRIKQEIIARENAKKLASEQQSQTSGLKQIIAKLQVEVETVEAKRKETEMKAEKTLRQIEKNLDEVLMNSLTNAHEDEAIGDGN